ncbi:MAG TPA: CPBP family intramembrane metalloprotease, partial [Lachnospiraceae bacterium]|nr:CPBP family intramembrane metalloprotease [Lachnospiraceae bacterium]
PLLLINGLIWGLWHAPLIVVGHNYGTEYDGYPYLGIAAMCVFCIVLGIFFSYVTMKTKSCFPSIIAHGAVNGFASAGVYFTDNGGNAFVGPAITGIVGGLPFIITAVILAVLMKRDHTLETYNA